MSIKIDEDIGTKNEFSSRIGTTFFSSLDTSKITRENLNNKDVFGFLVEIGFVPAVSFELLSEIWQNPSILDFLSINFVKYVLYAYISWSITYRFSKSFDGLILLIKSISNLINCLPERLQFSKILLIASFYYLFQIYAQSSPLISFEEYCSVLCDFFSFRIGMPEKSFEILSLVLQSVLKSFDPNSEQFSSICAKIGIISEEYHSIFPLNVASTICNLLSHLISDLNISALSLYSHLSHHIPINDIVRTVELFPEFISIVLFSDSNNIEENSDFVKLSALTSNEVCFRISPRDTFVSGFSLKSKVDLRQRIEIESLFSSDVNLKLSFISKIVDGNPELCSRFCKSFISYINFQKDKSIYIYAAFIFILMRVLHCIDKELILKFIFSSPIFHPGNTIYTLQKDFYPIIDSIRNCCIDIIVYDTADFSFLFQSLLVIIQYPLLFSETMQRLIRVMGSIKLADENIPIFAKTMMSISLYYQQQDYSTSNNNDIEIARSTVFLFLSHLINNNSYSNILFSNTYFVTFFISFVFENSLRGYILSSVLSLLSLSSNTASQVLVSIIDQILSICYSNFPIVSYILISTDVLICLNDSIAHVRSLSKSFDFISSSFFVSMPKLFNNEHSQKFFIQILQFLSLIGFVLDDSQIRVAEETIAIVFDKEIPQVLLNKIIQLLASDSISSLSPTFFIQQPRVIKLLLGTALNCDRFNEILDYIDQLIQFSSSNAQSCRQNDIDLYILDLVEDLSTKDISITNSLLAVFSHISIVISSNSVVQRYVSLMSHDSKNVVPHFHMKYLQVMNSIITSTLRLPYSFLRISSKTPLIDINGVSQIYLENGFSFCFWIFVDSNNTQYKPIILNLTDSIKGRRLMWFLSGNSIFFLERGDGFESTGKVDIPLPLQSWAFVAVSFKNNGYEAEVKTYINCVQAKPLDFSMLSFSPGFVGCTIGGMLNDSITPEYPVRIGSFGLFQYLDEEKIPVIYEYGPRPKGELPLKSIFYFVLIDECNRIRLHTVSACKDISGLLNGYYAKQNLTFTDVLLNISKIHQLIPVFSQIDMVPLVDDQRNQFTRWIIEIFGNAFSVSHDSQIHFHANNGFGTIMHVLYSLSEVSLTYSLYLQFYALSNSISYPNLQNDLFQHILLNPFLWIHSDFENHIRILKHWVRNIFTTFRGIGVKILSFKTCLTILRLFYWYDSDESTGIENYKIRSSGYNISECRSLIYQIALVSSSISFDIMDYNYLKSQILSFKDNQLVLNHLDFLNKLIRMQPSPLINTITEHDICSLLFPLYIRSKCLYINEIISIVLSIHTTKIISSFPINEIIYVITCLTNPYALTIESYKNILGTFFSNSIPEIFPLLCTLSWYVDNIEAFFRAIGSASRFQYCKHWEIIPTFLLFKGTEPEKQLIMGFLSSCHFSQWENVYSCIVLFSRFFGENSHYYGSLFLEEILKIIENTNNKSIEIVLSFLKIARIHIVFRESNDDNESLVNLFRNSPFFSMSPHRSPSLLLVKKDIFTYHVPRTHSESLLIEKQTDSVERFIFLFNDIMGFLSTFKDFKASFQFKIGIHFNENGIWSDIELSKKVMSLFFLINSRKYLFFDLFICRCVFEYDPDFVISHVQKLDLSDNEIFEASYLISILNNAATKRGYTSIIRFKELPDLSNVLNNFGSLIGDESDIIECLMKSQNCIRFLINDINISIAKSKNASDDDILCHNNNETMQYINEKSDFELLFKDKWSSLWKYLAADRAPWSPSMSDIRFSRDSTLCFSNCPFKMKRKFQSSLNLNGRSITGYYSKIIQNKSFICSSNLISSMIIKTPCMVIKPGKNKDAIFILTKNQIIMNYLNKNRLYPISELVYVFHRTKQHRFNSIELFFRNGVSLFICFFKQNPMDIILKFIDINPPSIKFIQNQSFYQHFQKHGNVNNWVNGKLSNFEYIMHLNMFSGRSFSDLSQYPIFPWLYFDFQQDSVMDIEEFYRDLTKPVGALELGRFEFLLRRLDDFKECGESQYLYGVAHSSSHSVSRFLYRLQPFSDHFLNINKDCAQTMNIFNSIQEEFESCLTNNNDFRELIPEFYFFPEFLYIHSKTDIQSTIQQNVQLPNWAKNPHEYIYFQRKILESNIVSSLLHNWFDLIWGYKQRGLPAFESFNVFRPELYDNIWEQKESLDNNRKLEIESLLDNCGQIPAQLFNNPHPRKLIVNPKIQIFKQTHFIRSDMSCKVVLSRVDYGKPGNGIRFAVISENGEISLCFTNFSASLSEENKHPRPSMRRIPGSMPLHWVNVDNMSSKSDVKEINSKEVVITRKEINNFSSIQSSFDINTVANLRKGKFAVVSIANGRVYIVDTNSLLSEEIKIMNSEAVCIASDKEYLVVSRKDSYISVFRLYEFAKPYQTIPSYRESLSCLAVSSRFHLLAMGTKDGSIVINSLNRSCPLRVVDLKPSQPKSVIITKSWGFIVVYASQMIMGALSHFLYCFSVNGDFIRKIQLSREVEAWDTWQSSSGFDYLLFSDDKGKLYSCEVFYLDIGESFYRCASHITSLKYIKDMAAVVAITDDGKVYIIPKNL